VFKDFYQDRKNVLKKYSTYTLAVLVHRTLRRPHATMQRSHPDTFHVAKVHRLCHGLLIHPLHGLKGERNPE